MVYRNDVPNSQDEKLFMNKNDLTERLNTLDRLSSELLSSLQSISDEKLNKKPKENAWSVLQICHHMMLVEQGSMNYLKKKLSFNPKLKKVSLSTRMRQKLLNTYINTPMKFKAPAGLGDDVLPITSSLEQITAQWKNTRSELRAFLFTLPEDLMDKEIYKHGFAGKLSLEGMLVFFEGHLVRHERQIRKTLKIIR